MSKRQHNAAVDPESSADFADLVARHLAGELDDARRQQLSADLAALPERRAEFVAMCIQAQLVASCVGLEFADEACSDDLIDAEDVDLDAMPPEQLPTAAFGLVGGLWHGTLGFFSQEIPFSLLVATVITCLGLLAGSMVYVSPHQQVALESKHTMPDAVLAKTEYVGQVTGMLDVRWADDSTAALGGAGVPLGRKYAIASGLMEITYNTGAKVILQGPVTYKVDSRDGGFLSIGKLTARLEKKAEGGRRKVDEAVHPKFPASSLSTVHYPLFTIRTPTATVTDLGTEFGVYVDKNGVAEVHVYQGEVISRSNAAESSKIDTVHLKAGDAVQINPKEKKHVAVSFMPRRFVRKLSIWSQAETAYIDAVLADKPLAYWPLNERANAWEFADRAGHGFHGRTTIKITSGKQGPFGVRSHAVELDGRGGIDVLLGPDREKTLAALRALTVESWIWIGKGEGIGRILSVDGQLNGIRSGWGAGYASHASQLLFTNYSVHNYYLSDVKALPRQQWLYMAVTQDDANMVRFYVNGELRQSVSSPKSRMTGSVQMAIGRLAAGGQSWRGRLAHVAIYDRALSDREIHNHFEAGLDEGGEANKQGP